MEPCKFPDSVRIFAVSLIREYVSSRTQTCDHLQIVSAWFSLVTEEILKSPNALWFSPDAQLLVYACFNDSLVGELKYPWYGRIQERLRYPQIRMLRYPKVNSKSIAKNTRVFLFYLCYTGLRIKMLQLCNTANLSIITY